MRLFKGYSTGATIQKRRRARKLSGEREIRMGSSHFGDVTQQDS